MNADEILLSLDNNYRKCPVCKKYYDIIKNEKVHMLSIGSGNYIICFLCNWLHGAIRKKINEKIITVDHIQIFLPLYDVTWDDGKCEYVCIPRKDSDVAAVL